MKKLKNQLAFDWTLCILCILLLFRILLPFTINLEGNHTTGTLIHYQIKGAHLTMEIQGQKKYMISYYFKTEQEKNNFHPTLGSRWEILGKKEIPSVNRNFYGFNYKDYLASKGIYIIWKAEKIHQISNKISLFYRIKDRIVNNFKKRENAEYLMTLVLGDSSQLLETEKENLRKIGIGHLFAISGMHVGFLTMALMKLFSKQKKLGTIIIVLFLIFYLFLTGASPSIMRAACFFILLQIKKLKKWNISNQKILIILALSMLILRPSYIYSVSFQFSFLITFAIIHFSPYLKERNYISKVLLISILSFLIGLPISMYHFSTINFLTPLWNLFYVPFMSFILFPFTILNCFFQILEPIYDCIIDILKVSIDWCNHWNFMTFSFSRLPLYAVILSVIISFYVVNKLCQNKYFILIPFLIFLIIHYNIRIFDFNYHMTLIDVGQGDSILLELPQRGAILIDTGGQVSYGEPWQKSEYSLAKNTIVPYLNARGIHKLNYLILTHGDMDHAKETITLSNLFPIDQILMNEGSDNTLEKNIKRSVSVPIRNTHGEIITLNHTQFQIINFKNNNNENEDSLLLYTKWNDMNILLMGDAGKSTEEKLIQKYPNLKIDLLKIGHHGSKESSSMPFLKSIQPSTAFISAGKNNRFRHPHEETLSRLRGEKIQVYMTNEVGMIRVTCRKKCSFRTRFPFTR